MPIDAPLNPRSGCLVHSPVDHQVLPRGADDQGRAAYLVPAGSAPLVRVTGSAGDVACDVEASPGGDHILVSLPVGGPYRLQVIVAGQVLHQTRGLYVGDVWVLAGQSNMVGAAAAAHMSEPASNCSMLSADGRWKPATDPLHRLYESREAAQFVLYPDVDPACSEELNEQRYAAVEGLGQGSVTGGIGPGLSFARELHRLSGVPVGLIPCALGSTSLEMWTADWRSPRGVDGNLNANLLARAKANGPVAGMLWYQGESDTAPDAARGYLDGFERFLSRLRADLGQPDLPVVTAQLAATTNWPDVLEPFWAQVREAQRLAAGRLVNVEVVATADLPLEDGLHLSADGASAVGVRMARAASQYVGGARERFNAPMWAALRRDGSRIECAVTGANGSLRAPEDLALLFRTDRPVVDAAVLSHDLVVVETDGPASWLGYCLGFRDSTQILDDAGMALPAFGPLPVS